MTFKPGDKVTIKGMGDDIYTLVDLRYNPGAWWNCNDPQGNPIIAHETALKHLSLWDEDDDSFEQLNLLDYFEKRCECGSEKTGSSGHSTWCPKGGV